MATVATIRGEQGGAQRDGARMAGREAALSVIAAGTSISGELNSDGVVKVEGVIVGSVRASRQVLVAKGGRIEGDVYTAEAVVGGEVHGSILADERVEVQANSVIQGDITTQRILVHEGGEVNGNVRMGNPQALRQPLSTDRNEPADVPEPSTGGA